MTDPDRLTDEARDELVERLETEACIAAKAEDGLCASLLREAAAALRSTPEAGTGDETCPCCQRHCRRSPGFLEHGISLDMDLEVEAEERERGGPPSPLLALAEELEARADEQSGDYQVPIGDWSVRRWSQLRAWKGATLAYRKAAALARDYATREESDDD